MKKLLVLLLALSLYSLKAQVYDTLVWADEFNGTGLYTIAQKHRLASHLKCAQKHQGFELYFQRHQAPQRLENSF